MNSSLTQESINYRNICFDAVFKSEQEQPHDPQKFMRKMVDASKEELLPSGIHDQLRDKGPEVLSEVISESPLASSFIESNTPGTPDTRDPIISSKEESKSQDEKVNAYPSEYCETHYYGKISILKPELVFENKYWADLANHIAEKK